MEPPSDAELKQDLLVLLRANVFATRQLPNAELDDEARIVKSFVDFLTELNCERYRAMLSLCKQFYHDLCHPIDKEELLKRLDNYRSQDVFFFLENHGAMLRFQADRTSPENSNIIVSLIDCTTMPERSNANITLSLIDNLQLPLHGFLQIPRFAVSVAADRILSGSFVSELVQLHDQDFLESYSVVRKQQNLETREPHNPTVLLDWLVPFLAGTLVQQHNALKKKLLTEAVFSEGNPFRRAPCYLALKYLLHLSMVDRADSVDEGHADYKCLMMQFIGSLCELYLDDVDSEMVGKLARKARKLEAVLQRHTSFPSIEFHRQALQKASETGAFCRGQIRSREKGRIGQLNLQNTLDLSFLNQVNFTENDCTNFEIQSLHKLLSEPPAHPSSPVKPVHAAIMKETDRHLPIAAGRVCDVHEVIKSLTTDLAAVLKLSNTSWRHRYSALQTLHNVLLALWECHPHWLCASHEVIIQSVYRLFTLYHSSYATSDPFKSITHPEWQSTRMLNFIVFVVIMDQLAVQWNPEEIYCGHQLPIAADLTKKLVERMWLPSLQQRRCVASIESYVQTRTHNSLHPSLHSTSSSGLPARYATKNEGMQDYLKEKGKQMQRLEEDKRKEVKEKQAVYYEWDTKYRNSTCNKTEVYDKYSRTFMMEHVEYSCTRCGYAHERDSAALKVQVYERELPESKRRQLLVAFDACCPPGLRCVSLACVHFMDIGALRSSRAQFASSWKEDLKSTIKPLTQTHYKHPIPPTDPPDSYIKWNARDTHFGDNTPWVWKLDDPQIVDSMFTISVSPQYQPLDLAVNGWVHTQNMILALQNKCPDALDQSEFVEFGSLRSDGGNLQLRNIARAVEGRLLSFGEESVVSLISAAVSQLGPVAMSYRQSSHAREWNAELFDDDFLHALVASLDQLMTSVQKNWQQHRTLQCVASILRHITVLRPYDAVTCGPVLQLLLKCRLTASAWQKSLQEAIAKLDNTQADDRLMLRRLSVLIAQHQLQLYNLSESWLPHVLGEASRDLPPYLEALNFLASRAVDQFDYKYAQCQAFAATMHCQAYVVALLETTEGRQVFDEHIRHLWTDASKGNLSPPAFSASNAWVSAEWTKTSSSMRSFIDMNLVFGTLWINAAPLSSLPDNILDHSTYQSTFPNFSPEVNPSERGHGFFVTRALYHGAQFTFGLKDDRLIVYREQSGQTLELLHADDIKCALPHNLQCAHWWMDRSGSDGNTPTVEFRPVGQTKQARMEAAFWPPHILADYLMDVNTGTIRHGRSGQLLVSMSSKLFTQLNQTVFSRLDNPLHIYMLVESASKAKAKLQRLDLVLEIDVHPTANTHAISCSQYQNMVVDEQQFCGTLHQLYTCLYLKSKAGSTRRLILAPNFGHHSFTAQDCAFHADWSTLSADVPFFEYEIDCELWTLKASNSTGVLYLAYLHALTGQLEHDPFLGCHGLDMAVQYLQRSFVNQPLDTASLAILDSIVKLVPKRMPYPEHLRKLEIVTWPSCDGAAARSDILVLLVYLIKVESRRMNFLHGVAEDASTDLQLGLRLRAYLRSKASFNCRAHLTASQETELRALLNSHETTYSMNYPSLLQAPVFSATHQSRDQTTGFSVLQFLCEGNIKGLEDDLSEAAFEDDTPVLALRRFFSSSPRNVPSPLCTFMFLYKQACELRETNAPRFHALLSLFVWKWRISQVEVPAGYEQFFCSLVCVPRSQSVPLSPQCTTVRNTQFWNSSAISSTDVSLDIYDHDIMKHYYHISTSYSEQQKMDRDRGLRANQIREKVWECVQGYKGWRGENPRCKVVPKHVEFCLPHITHLSNSANVEKQWNNRLLQLSQAYKLRVFAASVDKLRLQITADWNGDMTPSTLIWPALCPMLPLPEFQQLADVNDTDGLQLQAVSQCGRCDELEHMFSMCLQSTKADNLLATRCYEEVEAELSRCQQKLTKLSDAGEFDRLAPLVATMQQLKSELLTCPKRIVFPFPLEDAGHIEELQRPIGAALLQKLKDSNTAYGIQQRSLPELVADVAEQLAKCQRLAVKKTKESWERLHSLWQSLPHDHVSRLCDQAGLRASLTPTRALSGLCSLPEGPSPLRALLSCFAIYATYYRKAERCLSLLHATPPGTVNKRLLLELQTERCANWTPEKYPQWLLFELENNILIRAVQSKVAQEMLADIDDGTKNRCLQLNMGEGKTSVIIPLLCSVLGKPKTPTSEGRVVRVTVLTSLYRSNVADLGFRLTGLLSRRLFVFPCVRSVPFDTSNTDQLYAQLQECQAVGGCIVTVPEHRLSFELKNDEMCCRCDARGLAVHDRLQRILDWYSAHCVDLLDESDELLSHKYQLVYTAGSQQVVAGGRLRWEVLQGILEEVHRAAPQFAVEQQTERVDYKQHLNEPSRWGRLRFLSPEVVEPFVKLISRKVLESDCRVFSDLKISAQKSPQLRDFILKFITGEVNVTERSHQSEIDFHLEHANLLLILRGFLKFNVLVHVLGMRWSVQYGVGARTTMAIPFKAKDVASERTEFGHVDVAIVASQLSYYETGLTLQQFTTVLEMLKTSDTRQQEYAQWVALEKSGAAGICRVPSNLQTVEAVNLSDSSLVRDLYVIFQYNMRVVNFFLSNLVFPKGTKQFPHKLMRSAWDLASGRQFAVRGFSGTNDSDTLFPLSMVQKDLVELDSTNGEVLNMLVKPENQCTFVFDKSLSHTSRGMIEYMVQHQPHGRVLIDGGALMVDMNNRQVAETWLALNTHPHIRGAIFFEADQLMVLNRDGNTMTLRNSPLRNMLDACLCYLDDFHTRGTDVKFPIGTHAYVTVGPKMAKDKLVQSAMRMRQLGCGHTVSFFCAQEVVASMQNMNIAEYASYAELSSREVLFWTLCNSAKLIETALPMWALQGLSYGRRQCLTRYLQQLSAEQVQLCIKLLVKICLFDEVLSLKDLYGILRTKTLASVVVEASAVKLMGWLDQHRRQLLALLTDLGELYECTAPFQTLKENIVARSRKYLDKVYVFSSMLEEEQERELEEEVEEEREVFRPGSREPMTPIFPEAFEDLLKAKPLSDEMLTECSQPLSAMFQSTSLCHHFPDEAGWLPILRVSDDLLRTVKKGSARNEDEDEFVRPPNSVLLLSDPHRNLQAVIFISPHEAHFLVRAQPNPCYKVIHIAPLFRDRQRLSLQLLPRDSFLSHQLALLCGSVCFENDQALTRLSALGFAEQPLGNRKLEDFIFRLLQLRRTERFFKYSILEQMIGKKKEKVKVIE